MLYSQIPSKFSIPFANSAVAPYIQAIPTGSQIGITGGAASLTDGFPPLCFVPVGAGGIPPWGRDFNGLFNQITAWIQFSDNAGVLPQYDSTFSSQIGGYPYGAFLAALNGITAGSPQGGNHAWFSTIDNNTTNPDTTFNSANWVPVPAVIDSSVSFTIGPGGSFSNLLVAIEYLSKFNITNNGFVNLTLTAGVQNYSTTVIMNHPQNERISLVGATMLGAVGTTDASYAVNGSSASTRTADAVTNLAYLRSKFATELAFTSGGGFEVDGTMLNNLDAILFTSDGLIGLNGDGQGCAFNCHGGTNAPGSDGLAFVGFTAAGISFISGGSIQMVGTGPLIAVNCQWGMVANNSGAAFVTGNIISIGNSLYGLYVNTNAMVNSAGAVYAECNGDTGVAILQGRYAHGGAHLYKNANYGMFCTVGSSAAPLFTDFATGTGNANGSRSVIANDMGIVAVGTGSINFGDSIPSVNVVGNNNSLITTT